MRYQHIITPALESTIGKEGIGKAEFAKQLERTAPVISAFKSEVEKGKYPAFSAARDPLDLEEIKIIAGAMRYECDRLVVLGTGGSNLGAQTLVSLKAGFAAPLPVQFMDNVDPHSMQAFLKETDFKRTSFLAVSKSGSTVETLSQMMVILAHLKKLGLPLMKHFSAITMPGDSPLRALCETYNIRVIDHHPDVGGRFSVLSNVGLIPAAFAGVDVDKVRTGAAEVLQEVFSKKDSAPAQGAALHQAFYERGRNIAVLMVYADRLAHFGMWYRQLWAESIGKDGKGSTPIRAMGAVDQHSQLQLYLDGPKDKLLSFLTLQTQHQDSPIDTSLVADERLAYIRGRSMGDVIDALARGTIETLTQKRCPLRQFVLPALDEAALGALLMHFMCETVIACGLMGVKAFDQPAVEQSKRLAREYLARK